MKSCLFLYAQFTLTIRSSGESIIKKLKVKNAFIEKIELSQRCYAILICTNNMLLKISKTILILHSPGIMYIAFASFNHLKLSIIFNICVTIP